MVRDPAFPDVPHLAELYATRSGRPPAGPLYDAWRASAAAAQLEFGLVLPQLTPAAMVSLWRNAGTRGRGFARRCRRWRHRSHEQTLGGPEATGDRRRRRRHARA